MFFRLELAVQKSRANRNGNPPYATPGFELAVQKSRANRNASIARSCENSELAVQKSRANRNRIHLVERGLFEGDVRMTIKDEWQRFKEENK